MNQSTRRPTLIQQVTRRIRSLEFRAARASLAGRRTDDYDNRIKAEQARALDTLSARWCRFNEELVESLRHDIPSETRRLKRICRGIERDTATLLGYVPPGRVLREGVCS